MNDSPSARPAAGLTRPVALMMPGQGAQHPGMATGLYQRDPVFTCAVDEVFGLLGRHGREIRADWLAQDPAVSIDHVSRAQPLLFAVEYGLARMVLGWGVRPAVLIGHSLGEFVAAVLAGVFDLATAAALLWDRVTQVAAAPPGGMLAVRAGPAQVAPFLGGDVALAAVNAPRQVLLAGPSEELAAAGRDLRAAGFLCRPASATSAFHSPALAAAAAASLPAFRAARPRPPAIPVYSAAAARPLTAGLAASASFWARQVTAPVHFWPALDAVLAGDPLVLLDTGPAQGLTAVARNHRAVASGRCDVVPLLPPRWSGPAGDVQACLAAAGRLQAEGHGPGPDALAALRAGPVRQADRGELGSGRRFSCSEAPPPRP